MDAKEIAKNYLTRALNCTTEIKTIQQDKEDLYGILYSIGGMSDSERVQTSRDNDKFGTIYAKIDSLDRKISLELDKLVEIKLEIAGKIRLLQDKRYIELLHKRYIMNETFQNIANEMGYSYRYVTKMHGIALQKFATILEQDPEVCQFLNKVKNE